MTSEPSDTHDPAAFGRRMRELLNRQVELYQRLERLCAAQRECVEREDSRPLLSLLSERQRLTTALTALSAELAPFRTGWESIKPLLSSTDRSAVEGLFREVGDRLRRILDADEADARLLAARRDALACDLRGLDTARRTHQAYGQAPAERAAILEGMEA